MITLDKAYELLGISPDASDEEVKKAYKQKAKDVHPDTHPNDTFATFNFQLLQEAMDKINDERKNSHNNVHTENQSSDENTYSSYNNKYTKNQYQSYGQNTYSSYNNEEYANRSYSSQAEQSKFATERTDLLNILKEIYFGIKKHNYRNIKATAVCLEIAYKCAYGALLRHALEYILHDKAKEINIIPEGRSSDELLTFIIDNYFVDGETKTTFYDAKLITNQLTHIEHYTNPKITFESCRKFYNQKFKQIIELHLSSGKKRNPAYLRKIYNQLENFDIKNPITNTLLLGSLMRQILECIVDLRLYNQKFIPKDGRITIKDKLDFLNDNLRNPASGRPNYTFGTINNLHSIRKAVNQAMHVAPDNMMNISKIRSVLMAHTNILDFELEMPTDSPTIIAKERPHWWNVLIWIFFFPILIPIKIGKSNMETGKKVISIFLAIGFITWPFIGGLFVALPTHIMLQTRAVITVDVNDVVDSLVGNYNHYGCFVSDEISQTQVVKDKTYIIRIKKDSVLDDGTLLALTINRDNDVVGTASIKAIHEQYLSNGDEIRFEIGEEIEGNYQIELTETTISVKNLNDTEIIRNDPREHLKLVFSHKVTEGFWTYNWNKIKLNKSEYTIGDKTIRLSLIEDKRPGAEEVNPGLKFEVFDSYKKSIAVGEYIFVNLQYDANYDDYGKMYTNSFDLTPNFDQAEMLTKTGILFIDTVSTYNF